MKQQQQQEREVVIMTIKEIIEQGYKEHHTATVRRYVPRRPCNDSEAEFPCEDGYGFFLPYKGRFGEGWALYEPNWASTYYSYITYYTKEVKK